MIPSNVSNFSNSLSSLTSQSSQTVKVFKFMKISSCQLLLEVHNCSFISEELQNAKEDPKLIRVENI